MVGSRDPSGEDFQKVIFEALEAAVCVIVAWSSDSIRFDMGDNRRLRPPTDEDALVPVYLEMVPIPVPFNLLQSVHSSIGTAIPRTRSGRDS